MYTKTYNITAGDMDINYRMTPGAALLYFQDCFASYLSHYSIGSFDIVKEGKIWVISDFDLHFTDHRAMWADHIAVQLNFSEITSCRAYISFEMRVVATGRVFAKGDSCWTALDLESRFPCNVMEILQRAGAEDKGERHKKVNPRIRESILKTEEVHNINYTDLDFNGHVCNRSYMAMAMSTIPLDFIRISNPTYVHIKFAKESFIGDVLSINVYCDAHDGNIIFHDIRNKAGDVICTVYSEWKTDREGLSEDPGLYITR